MMVRGQHAIGTPLRGWIAVATLAVIGAAAVVWFGVAGARVAAEHYGWHRHQHSGASATIHPTATHPAAASASTASRPKTPTVTRYTVKAGDTLWDIAQAFRVQGRVVALFEWNRSVIGRNPDLIFPGQVIIVDPTGKIKVGR